MPHRAVIAVPVYGQFGVAIECLRAIAANSPADVEILVVDDGSPEVLADNLPADIRQDPRFRVQRNASNLGFVGTANIAMGWHPSADLVLVNSDVLVSVGWFDRLESAAYATPNNATVSVLADEGSILSVRLGESAPVVPDSTALAELNIRLAELPQVKPAEIPVGIGHCLYIHREAIDAVGSYDEAFAPGYGEEVDFSLRCRAAGFHHVVAPDVFVLHRGRASFGAAAHEHGRRAARLLLSRYPDYDRLIRGFVGNPEPLETLFRRVLIANGRSEALTATGTGRLFAPATKHGETLFALRRSVIGRALFPPGSARSRAVQGFLWKWFRLHP
jgi:GT2 family glycosyltransferase